MSLSSNAIVVVAVADSLPQSSMRRLHTITTKRSSPSAPPKISRLAPLRIVPCCHRLPVGWCLVETSIVRSLNRPFLGSPSAAVTSKLSVLVHAPSRLSVAAVVSSACDGRFLGL